MSSTAGFLLSRGMWQNEYDHAQEGKSTAVVDALSQVIAQGCQVISKEQPKPLHASHTHPIACTTGLLLAQLQKAYRH